MKQSQLFTKTQKNLPADETSRNAQLLIKAGFIHKEMAGVYSFLPLGLRVMEKIKGIVREEMNNVGGQEIKMTALQQKDNWEKTGRWSDEVVSDWFKTKLKNETELGLAFTHEESLTQIMIDHINSYKDLPFYPYQFQTKFRNELRTKSGLLRGREFLMKDLYDFSLDEEQHQKFYDQMKDAYMKIFERVGIGDRTYMTISNGGSFSKYSYEFQTLCEAGEDVLIFDPDKRLAINKVDFNDEVFDDFGIKKEDYNFQEQKSAEVGDIYSLGTKYSEAIGLSYKKEDGEEVPVYMGSYGIGIPRLMAVVVETFNDKQGIIWPESVAPFRVHLISIGEEAKSENLYNKLQTAGVEALWDDREEVRPGEKFAEADLIGLPYRVVVSEKSLKTGGLELKKRSEKKTKIISEDELLQLFNK